MEAEQRRSDGEPTRLPVYAVIRFDPSRSGAAHQVMVWEVLADIEEAEAEVEHLNAQVPEGRDTTYFVSASSFYPEGRHAPRERWGFVGQRPLEKPCGPPAPRERIAEEWGFLVEAVGESDSSGADSH